MDPLVEPDDRRDRATALLDDQLLHGVPPRDADRYVAYLLAHQHPTWWPNGAAVNPLSEATRQDWFVRLAGEAYRDAPSENDARFALLCSLVQRGVLVDATGKVLEAEVPLGRVAWPPILRDLLPRFLGWDLDLRRALAWGQPPDWLRAAIFGEPAARGILHPADYLDRKSLRAWDRFATRSGGDAKGPGQVGFWFRARGVAALSDLLNVAKDEPLETVGRVAGAILQEYAYPLAWCESRGDGADDGSWQELLPWCDLLAERVPHREEDVDLLGTYFDAVLQVDRRAPGGVPDPQRPAAARLAGRALGRLRRAAQEQGPSAPEVGSPSGRLAHQHALGALAVCDGMAAALKAGVLVLRTLREPAVATDLRWWADPPLEPVPLRWSWLPSTLVALVHSRGRTEQRADPELREVRSAFARFLLDRLKPRADGEAALRIEPDAAWRRCCIRAVRELAINPEGRGHRTLHRVAESDPDEDVRTAARDAYDDVRRADGSTGDSSPRRRLVAALWWLRQAHRLALGLDIDPAGARRTRQKEISYTTETPTDPA